MKAQKMKKGNKSYQKPRVICLASRWVLSVCAGSGNTKFLNEDGTQGFMNSVVEQDGNAAEAASRRFDDDEYE